MGLIESIKNLFKRGGYKLVGNKLVNITDHPKVNADEKELKRIERAFREYRNDYPKIEYLNSFNQERKRDYMTINMRKLTAEMMASLVFNEQAEIKVDIDSANEFIEHTFEHNDFKKNLSKYLEPMFVAGGLVVRPYADKNSKEIEFSWGLADAFIPIRSTTNGIAEGVMTFRTMDTEGKEKVFYTLLEFHEWDGNTITITNELYRSDRSEEIGEEVPLGYNGQFEGLERTAKITNMNKPLFNYLRTAGFNNFSPHSPLGVGICDNSVSTLKQINDSYDQFNWEILMGQRTVLVSDHFLRYAADETGNAPKPSFDPSVNIYKAVRMEQGKEVVKDITNDIRTNQYIEAINQFMKTLEMQMQLSVGTFSFDGKSVKTATEIVSENSLTYRTRNMQCTEVEKFIKGLVVSTLELAKRTIINGSAMYAGEIPTFEQISVNFDDGIFESRDQLLEFWSKAGTIGYAPPKEAIKAIFKLTDEQAEEWYQQVLSAQMGRDLIELEERSAQNELGAEE